MTSRGYRTITSDSPEWTVKLSHLGKDVPKQLFVKGDANLLRLLTHSVAIVGSRAATAYGTEQAMNMANDLTQQGVTVVSGLAFGIDAAAHRGALSAGGATIAVLPCGIDRVYPLAHAVLAETILNRGGLLVSEYEPGAVPSRTRFLDRNRLIVALTQGTVVVESALRSGSMNSATWATGLGRVLMAVPGPVTSTASHGTNELIRAGQASLVMDAGDVLQDYS